MESKPFSAWRCVVTEAKRALISLDGLRIEVLGESLRRIKLRISSLDSDVEVGMDAESLLYLLDRLRFTAETVISQLS